MKLCYNTLLNKTKEIGLILDLLGFLRDTISTILESRINLYFVQKYSNFLHIFVIHYASAIVNIMRYCLQILLI